MNGRTQDIEFLVKWKNYPEEENTWEPYGSFIRDSPKTVEKYFILLDNKIRISLLQGVQQIKKQEETI